MRNDYANVSLDFQGFITASFRCNRVKLIHAFACKGVSLISVVWGDSLMIAVSMCTS